MKKLFLKYNWIIIKTDGADIIADLNDEDRLLTMRVDDGYTGKGNGLGELWHIYVGKLYGDGKIFEGVVSTKHEFEILMKMLGVKPLV